MNISTSKENILKKIRKALSHTTPVPFPASEGNQSVFVQQQEELELVFAEAFSKLQGKFVFCADRQELHQNLETLLKQKDLKRIFSSEEQFQSLLQDITQEKVQQVKDCDAAVTACEFLVARTGSIVLSSAQLFGRTASVYAPVHICIATTKQLVYDVRDGLKSMKERYGRDLPSMISFASGPSRTADIEKTLVVGVHGPKAVYLFLVDA